jgi:hypothetical protein
VTAISPPAPSVSAGGILRDAFAAYRRRFRRVAGCALALLVPLAVLDTVAVFVADRALDELEYVPEWAVVFGVLTGTLSALGGVFYSGLIDRVVASDRRGEPEYTIGEVIETLPYLRLITADLLLVALAMVGLILLVVPGVVAFTLFCLVGPLIVSEDLGVRAAFRRSAELVRGHFWLTLGLVAVPLVLEHELINVVEHMAFEHDVALVLGLHVVLALGVTAFVALVQVTLAYELAGRYPPAGQGSVGHKRRGRSD